LVTVAGTSEADGTWLFRWSLLFNTTALVVLLAALLVICFVVITVLLLTRNKRGLDVSYKIYVKKLQCLTTKIILGLNPYDMCTGALT